MSYFVEVSISPDKCQGLEQCGACVKVCPVNIFEKSGGMPGIIADNQDECILCGLCLDECKPGAIAISKKY